MKKIAFYRLVKSGNGTTFEQDTGYWVHISHCSGFILDLAIARNKYGRWDITHTATGLLCSVRCGYYTRQEAFDSITEELVTAIISKLGNTDVIRLVDRLSEYAYSQQAIRA